MKIEVLKRGKGGGVVSASGRITKSCLRSIRGIYYDTIVRITIACSYTRLMGP